MRRPPRWLQRMLLIVPIAVAALWGSVWGAASALAPGLVRRMMPVLLSRHRHIGLTEVSFSSLYISPWLNRLTLRDFHARFYFTPRDDYPLHSLVETRELEVRLRDLRTLRGSVHAEGIAVRLDASDLPPWLPFDSFTDGSLVVTDLPLGRPRQAATEILERLDALVVRNEAVRDVQFGGDVTLTVKGVESTTRLYAERQGDRFRLRFLDSDIGALAEKMQLNLAPEQLDIVSLYPQRVPALLLITVQARDRSREYEPRNSWIRDAHRHVTWSYLLTRHFGPEFAETVTDAQEMKPGNTPSQRAMDIHNNAMGRRLFAEGTTLDALPRLVREHPEIIRHPNEVKSFATARRLH